MTEYRPQPSGTGLTHAPTLTTDRLVLRSLAIADFEAFHAMWAEPYVAKYILGTPSTPQESWRRLLGLVGHWALIGYGYWAVTDRQSGAFLGAVGFGDFMRPATPPFHGTPEAGWTMTQAAKGRGLAREAVNCVLDWGDRTLSAAQTVCIIDPDNAGSLRLAEAVGFGQPETRRYKDGDILMFTRPRP